MRHSIKFGLRARSTWRSRLFGCLLVSASAMTAAQSYGAPSPLWTMPMAPFRITDNIYYVGSRDLASYLIVTPAGDILINSNLATSPPQILESIRKLGFKPT